MSLSSSQLDAFVAAAQTRSFSKAAKSLSITQSALSQRIANLESDLGTYLLIRDRAAVRLTEPGENLLRYCQIKNELEAYFLQQLKPDANKGMAGLIRIGGFSSVLRSVALRSMRDTLVLNPAVQIQLMPRELRDLPELLTTGACDFLLLDRPMERNGLESELLGYEELVVAESQDVPVRDVFLDHDSEDTTTLQFFRGQDEEIKSRVRSYMGDIYGIIEGVELGLGRAVLSRHLVEGNAKIRVLSSYRPLHVPVYLVYYQHPFYTDLQKKFMEVLKAVGGNLLKSSVGYPSEGVR